MKVILDYMTGLRPASINQKQKQYINTHKISKKKTSKTKTQRVKERAEIIHEGV